MLEILLIILAWRKGWRWKALLPTVVTVFIVLLSGAAAGEDGPAIGLVILAVIGEFTALIIMSGVEPSRKRAPQKLHGEAIPEVPKEMKA